MLTTSALWVTFECPQQAIFEKEIIVRFQLENTPHTSRKIDHVFSEAKQELQILTEKREWSDLQAVKSKQVYLADFNLFTQPSPSTLTDGIELLASIFHPNIFDTPNHLVRKYCKLDL